MARLNSVSDIEPVSIGIDVGWAAETRSCCLAVDGLNPPDEDHPMLNRTLVIYRDDAPQTWAMRFQLDELCAFIPTFFADLFARSLRKCSLVIDGPVGPNGPPIQNRGIDAACRRGAFHNRSFPNDITGNDGPVYVDSTYRILAPFLEAAGCDEPWWGGPVTAESFTFAETHPTVGMALMLSQMPIAQIASRNQPLLVMTDPEELIRAKSDWYWRCGANNQVATILGTEAICGATDHELRAGLYCLAVAKMLETSRGTEASDAVAIGFEDGVYAVSRRIHNDWQEATTWVADPVNNLGMNDLLQGDGNFEYHQDPTTVPDFQQWEGVHGQQADDGEDDVPPLDEVDDIQDDGADNQLEDWSYNWPVVVNDHGCLWETHNDWIDPERCWDVRFLLLDEDRILPVRFEPFENPDHRNGLRPVDINQNMETWNQISHGASNANLLRYHALVREIPCD